MTQPVVRQSKPSNKNLSCRIRSFAAALAASLVVSCAASPPAEKTAISDYEELRKVEKMAPSWKRAAVVDRLNRLGFRRLDNEELERLLVDRTNLNVGGDIVLVNSRVFIAYERDSTGSYKWVPGFWDIQAGKLTLAGVEQNRASNTIYIWKRGDDLIVEKNYDPPKTLPANKQPRQRPTRVRVQNSGGLRFVDAANYMITVDELEGRLRWGPIDSAISAENWIMSRSNNEGVVVFTLPNGRNHCLASWNSLAAIIPVDVTCDDGRRGSGNFDSRRLEIRVTKNRSPSKARKTIIKTVHAPKATVVY